jgi:3-hydroxybutyryl-CoA dehydrogenase
VRAEEVKRVGVIGCGVMGAGIVEISARAGLDVVYLEATPDLVERGRQRLEASLGRAAERGSIAEEERRAALERVRGTTSIDDLSDAELILEAATEDRDIKEALFRELDGVVRPEVVFGSNTSSIPIVELGAATQRPDHVVGIHWFNPVPVMGLVEIVRSITTSDETVEFARAFGAMLGKTTVLSRDRAGFIVNTLLIPYLNDAIRMLEDGFATGEDIDTAIHLGLNHPMGPLRLADLIGLDTCLQISNVLYEEFRDARFAPPPLLKRMVTAGHLGRKTAKGFFDYV